MALGSVLLQSILGGIILGAYYMGAYSIIKILKYYILSNSEIEEETKKRPYTTVNK